MLASLLILQLEKLVPTINALLSSIFPTPNIEHLINGIGIMKIIEISIAIVKNRENLFLICLRPDNVHQGGKWEFPGGKVKENETPEQAMLRELKEEVAITAVDYRLLERMFFDYGDKQLNLSFFLINQFTGDAFANEGQLMRWVKKADLQKYTFPDANAAVIAKL
ncbi:MAG TPA: 8-oxo-dGTP diphosphatase MutT [Psychromonas sp.]